MAYLQTTGISGSLTISSSGIRNSGSGSLFNVNGYNGRLLNVVDSLSGSLFSVNTVAGLPVFEVFSNNKVVAGKYNANDFVISGSRVGVGTSNPNAKLEVSGSNATSIIDGVRIGRGAGDVNSNTVVGRSALTSNTTGRGNSAFGSGSLTNNTTGRFNSAFGYKALASNTTGRFNSAFGYKALASNIGGQQNNAFGMSSLLGNTAGLNNNAFGVNALMRNTVGSHNNAFGNNASNQTTGSYNNAFGYAALQLSLVNKNNAFGGYALKFNTLGTKNSAFGHEALKCNTVSSSNSAFGYKALYTSIGKNNSAFGDRALTANRNADNNTAFGYKALSSNTGGGQNSAFGSKALELGTDVNGSSAFGYKALSYNTVGTANSAFGHNSLGGNITGNYNCAFGYLAGGAGNKNSSFGSRALTLCNGSENNNAFGYKALYNNTTNNNNAFGYYALRNNTTGYHNSAFGHQALASNTTGYGNSAFGYKALSNNTTGYGNSAFGYKALANNTTAYSNTAFGSGSLANNTVARFNTAFGAATLSKNVVGIHNIAVGWRALQNNISGSYNTALGTLALASNTTCAYNIAIGMQSLQGLRRGEDNVAVGYLSAFVNVSGSYNVIVGNNSFFEGGGNYNCAVGHNSLRDGGAVGRINVKNNNAFGYASLLKNQTSSLNAFGYRALASNTTGIKNSAFGHQSLGFNTIGTSNSAFGYKALASNTTGNRNNVFGNFTLAKNVTGNNNIAFGYNAGFNSSGSNNIIIGYNIDNPVLGKNNQVNLANLIFVSGSALGQGRQISTGSNVGIGTSSPAARLEVSGNVKATSFTGSFSGSVTNIAGTTNYIPKFTSSTKIGNSVIYDNGSNIGIGTTSPGLPLTTYNSTAGDGVGGIRIDRSATNREANLQFSTGGAVKWWFQLDNNSTDNLYLYDGASSTFRMTWLQTGNVGIGTTSPTAKLEIAGSNTNGYSLLLKSGNTLTGTSSIQVALGYNDTTYYRHSIRTRHNAGAAAGNNIDFYTWNYNTDSADKIGSKFVMTMQGDGNVGIGTSGPGAKLEVSGSSKNTLLNLKSPSNSNILFVTGSGCIGIGTPTPAQKLQVVGDIGFTGGITSRMLVSYTNLTNTEDWSNSPISIRERDLVNNTQTADKYSPNINFHWANVVAKSLWFDVNGILNWGEYDTNGIPAADGTIKTATFLATSNIGIGTTSLNANLSFGASIADNKIYLYDATNDKYGFGIRGSQLMIYAGAGGTATGGITFGKFDGTTFTENVRFQNGGNVGIGTTNPTAKLHVSASRSVTIANFEGGSANWSVTQPGLTTGTIHLDPGTTIDDYGNAITFGASDSADGTTAQAGIYIRSDGGYGTKMYFGTTNSYVNGSYVRMMIDHNGNVGIGTSSPAAKLHVTSSAATPSATFMGGSVGVGTATPAAQLDVNGSGKYANSLGVGAAASGQGRFTVNAGGATLRSFVIANSKSRSETTTANYALTGWIAIYCSSLTGITDGEYYIPFYQYNGV
jgi:hypothetical protein